MGLFIGAILAFGIGFAFTGRYRPTLASRKASPAINGFDDYMAAARTLAGNGGVLRATPVGGIVAESLIKKVTVARNQKALSQLRRAFGKVCRVPQTPRLWAWSPYLNDARDLARLLSAEADVRAESGDHAGAFLDGLDCIQMGEDMARGGPLMNGWSSTWIRNLGQNMLVRNLEKLSATDCGLLADRMQDVLAKRVPERELLEEERNLTMLMMSRTKDLRELVTLWRSQNGATAAIEGEVGKLAWHFVRDQTMGELEKYYRTALEDIDKPRNQRKRVPEPDFIVAKMYAPGLDRITMWATRWTLAIESFWRRSESAPITLRTEIFQIPSTQPGSIRSFLIRSTASRSAIARRDGDIFSTAWVRTESTTEESRATKGSRIRRAISA